MVDYQDSLVRIRKDLDRTDYFGSGDRKYDCELKTNRCAKFRLKTSAALNVARAVNIALFYIFIWSCLADRGATIRTAFTFSQFCHQTCKNWPLNRLSFVGVTRQATKSVYRCKYSEGNVASAEAARDMFETCVECVNVTADIGKDAASKRSNSVNHKESILTNVAGSAGQRKLTRRASAAKLLLRGKKKSTSKCRASKRYCQPNVSVSTDRLRAGKDSRERRVRGNGSFGTKVLKGIRVAAAASCANAVAQTGGESMQKSASGPSQPAKSMKPIAVQAGEVSECEEKIEEHIAGWYHPKPLFSTKDKSQKFPCECTRGMASTVGITKAHSERDSLIRSTICSLMERQELAREQHGKAMSVTSTGPGPVEQPFAFWPSWEKYKGTAAAPAFSMQSTFDSAANTIDENCLSHNQKKGNIVGHAFVPGGTMGLPLHDNEINQQPTRIASLVPSPGKILIYPSKLVGEMRRRKALSIYHNDTVDGSIPFWIAKSDTAVVGGNSSLQPVTLNGRAEAEEYATIRSATESDDAVIAELRLSVFSNYSEDSIQRNNFRQRSREVISVRRRKGATCIVATLPLSIYNELRRGKEKLSFHTTEKKFQPGARVESAVSFHASDDLLDDVVVGTVECSVHEFYGTRLGESRRASKILYITEVAVSPEARQCGLGRKLIQGVDRLALQRNVETIYLHVDVDNLVAGGLYRKAGYSKVEPHVFFDEFTRSLNLHDGATKGRRHFLLYKNLRDPVLLPTRLRVPLGFEVPN